jgi:hypothetical protein
MFLYFWIGNKMCNISEWNLLNRHIEPDKLGDDELILMFHDNADMQD